MGPKIAFHGGECCGVKIICSLGESPDNTADSIAKVKWEWSVNDYPDQCGAEVRSRWNMYNQKCEEETYLARIDRYIKYLDAVRPNGVIEIILNEDERCEDADECDCGGHQNRDWGPLLLERGFVCVTDCYNSNSGNRIFIYHRKTDKI